MIVYKTKYQSTKKYAERLSQKLDAPMLEADKIKLRDIKDYDTVVYLGGAYIGSILGFNFIKKNYTLIKDKKIIVGAVALTSKLYEAKQRLAQHNLTEEMKGKVPLYVLRGAVDYSKMNFIDRFLMSLLVKMEKKKDEKDWDEDTKALIESYGKSADFTDEKYLEPILKELNVQ
ncbi:MAG: flavodoxin [Clostridiaceae bacterium]|nr:flavodoxin [Clostridiaceae bacterium]